MSAGSIDVSRVSPDFSYPEVKSEISFNPNYKKTFDELNAAWERIDANIGDQVDAAFQKGDFPINSTQLNEGSSSIMQRANTSVKGEGEGDQQIPLKHAVSGSIETTMHTELKTEESTSTIIKAIAWMAHIDESLCDDLHEAVKSGFWLDNTIPEHKNLKESLASITEAQEAYNSLVLTPTSSDENRGEQVESLPFQSLAIGGRVSRGAHSGPMSLMPMSDVSKIDIPVVPNEVSDDLTFLMEYFTFRTQAESDIKPKPDKRPLCPKTISTPEKLAVRLKTVFSEQKTSATHWQLLELHSMCYNAINALRDAKKSEGVIKYFESIQQCVIKFAESNSLLLPENPKPTWNR